MISDTKSINALIKLANELNSMTDESNDFYDLSKENKLIFLNSLQNDLETIKMLIILDL